MSRSARMAELLETWRSGVGKEHTEHDWGADDCERCVAEMPVEEVISMLLEIYSGGL